MARMSISDKHERMLRALLKLPDNRRCADCDMLVGKERDGFSLRWSRARRPSCSFFLAFWAVSPRRLFFFRRDSVAETSLEGVAAWLESRSRPSSSLRVGSGGRGREREGQRFLAPPSAVAEGGPPASAQPLLKKKKKNRARNTSSPTSTSSSAPSAAASSKYFLVFSVAAFEV